MDQKIEGLGDIGRVIANAFQILADEKQMGAGLNVTRILRHVGEELAKERRVELVELLVPSPDCQRLGGIAGDKRGGDIPGHGFSASPHREHRVRKGGAAFAPQHTEALGDIGGVIADPLEGAGALISAVGVAEIAARRLAQRDNAKGDAANLLLEPIDLDIARDDAAREPRIVALEGIKGAAELGRRQIADLLNETIEPLKILVEGLDAMLNRYTCHSTDPTQPRPTDMKPSS